MYVEADGPSLYSRREKLSLQYAIRLAANPSNRAHAVSVPRTYVDLYETKPTAIKWASSRENLSSGFPSKRDSNQSPQLQRLSRKSKFTPVASLHMKLTKKRITKALISLCGCAGWSASVLFTNPRRQVFSRCGPLIIWHQNFTNLRIGQYKTSNY